MENRERDRTGQRTSSTEAGDVNRRVESERGRQKNSGTNAEFGQGIGRSENLSEGGEMRNRNSQDNSDLKNKDIMENESSRRSGSESGYGSSSGRRSGSLGSENESDVSRSSDKSSGRSGSGSLGNTGSSEGRH